MKKIIIIITMSIVINGCCGAGLVKLNDGNYYYADSCKCDKYITDNKGKAICLNKKQELVGVMQALTPEEVEQILAFQLYQYQQNAMMLQSINNSLQQTNMQLQQTTNQLNYNGQQAIQSINNSNAILHNYNMQNMQQYNNNKHIDTTCIRAGRLVINCKSTYK